MAKVCTTNHLATICSENPLSQNCQLAIVLSSLILSFNLSPCRFHKMFSNKLPINFCFIPYLKFLSNELWAFKKKHNSRNTLVPGPWYHDIPCPIATRMMIYHGLLPTGWWYTMSYCRQDDDIPCPIAARMIIYHVLLPTGWWYTMSYCRQDDDIPGPIAARMMIYHVLLPTGWWYTMSYCRQDDDIPGPIAARMMI